MCGRYIANSEEEITEIREILKQISMRLLNKSDTPPLSDIYPTNKVFIINNKLNIVQAKWGIEKWDQKGVLINARSETCEQSGFFKPFAKNRCIIPAHGYYEWHKTDDKNKVKYIFSTQNKHGIFMAGIYKNNASGKDAQDEFAIITRPAESKIMFIHDRMPLIIKAEQVPGWLSGTLPIRELSSFEIGISFSQAV